MDVLTNIPGKPHRFWGSHTKLVGPAMPPRLLERLLGKTWATRLSNVVSAIRIFFRRGTSRGVVTGGGLDGICFAWLQSVIPWGRKPHIMVDCNWYEPPHQVRRWFRKLQVKVASQSVEKFVVWASHEVKDYSRSFEVEPNKFEYVPFHPTLDGYDFELRDDGYLFAGGNYDRDYDTLIEAVRYLDVPVWIATTRPETIETKIPDHVRVEGTSAAGFRQAMAAARLVVVPMQNGLLHSGGQQTLLNAMILGKPAIAVGQNWARDFLIHGVTGLIVDYEDPMGLQRAVEWVLEHPEAAQRMADRGRVHAQKFSTHRCMQRIYGLVTEDDR